MKEWEGQESSQNLPEPEEWLEGWAEKDEMIPTGKRAKLDFIDMINLQQSQREMRKIPIPAGRQQRRKVSG